jgi:hypothetical protein
MPWSVAVTEGATGEQQPFNQKSKALMIGAGKNRLLLNGNELYKPPQARMKP